MSNIVIDKDGQLVATAKNCESVEILGEPSWEGIYLIKCYFFSRIYLSPPILFEHLAGTGMGKFLNGATLSVEGEPVVRDLRYVHGRSEVLRGRHTIGSVLLARPEPEGGVTDTSWLSYLPAVYKKFLAHHGRSVKSA